MKKIISSREERESEERTEKCFDDIQINGNIHEELRSGM